MTPGGPAERELSEFSRPIDWCRIAGHLDDNVDFLPELAGINGLTVVESVFAPRNPPEDESHWQGLERKDC